MTHSLILQPENETDPERLPESLRFIGPNEAYLAWNRGRVSLHQAWWGLSAEQRNLIWFAESVPRVASKPELLVEIWVECLQDHVQVWLPPGLAVRYANFNAPCIKGLRVVNAGPWGNYHRPVRCDDSGQNGAASVWDAETGELLMRQSQPSLKCQYDGNRNCWVTPTYTDYPEPLSLTNPRDVL